jgi:hypothetical protein
MPSERFSLFGAMRDDPSRWAPLMPAILEAVELLPEPHQTIIEGIYWERVSQKVMAERMWISRAMLARRISQAQRMIGGYLVAVTLARLFPSCVAGRWL